METTVAHIPVEAAKAGGNKRIASLLCEIEALFDEIGEAELSAWNSADSGTTESEVGRALVEQVVYIRKRVRAVLSEVIIRHLDETN